MWTTPDSFELTFSDLFRSIYMMAYVGYEFLLPRYHRHNVLYFYDDTERFVQHNLIKVLSNDLNIHRTQNTVKQIDLFFSGPNQKYPDKILKEYYSLLYL